MNRRCVPGLNKTDEICRGLEYSWECGFECNDPAMEFYTYTESHVRAADVKAFVAEKLSEGAGEILFRISDLENWNRDMHAYVVMSSVSKAAASATMFLHVNEEKGFARLTVRRL